VPSSVSRSLVFPCPTDGLCLLDRAKEAHRLLVVATVPARRAIRRRQQSPPLVVAQRLDVHSCAFRDLADSHAADYKPVPRYGNQAISERLVFDAVQQPVAGS
jgi:hypothetical protein